LQLIEIIQLSLLIIIALGVIVFLFSYLGYRAKLKVESFPKPKIEERKFEQPNSDAPAKSIKNSESIEQQVPIKPNLRFEVFTPASDDEVKIESEKSHKIRSHSPKTLIIKHKS